MSISINNLDKFLGQGAFSWVYSLNSSPFALKIDKFDGQSIDREFGVLSALNKINRSLFPEVLDQVTKVLKRGSITLSDGAGSSSRKEYMVMERLGVSLEELMCLRGELALSTIAQIGRQILAQLSLLIANGISHNDVKPDNILFGLAERRKQAFLIDYGLALNSDAPNTQLFRGSLTFSATKKLNGNCSCDLSNDLQSLIYVLLWTLKNGVLPWQQSKTVQSSIEQRAAQIIRLRHEFIITTVQTEVSSGDKRSTMIRQLAGILLLLHLQKGEDVPACELVLRLQSVL